MILLFVLSLYFFGVLILFTDLTQYLVKQLIEKYVKGNAKNMEA